VLPGARSHSRIEELVTIFAVVLRLAHRYVSIAEQVFRRDFTGADSNAYACSKCYLVPIDDQWVAQTHGYALGDDLTLMRPSGLGKQDCELVRI
jgi:hypothetical protein